MHKINVRIDGNAPGSWPRRRAAALASTVMALSVSGCATAPVAVAPATPTLVSIQGHGVVSGTNNPAIKQFRFNSPTWNDATKTSAAHIGTTVQFTVPYPTGIELQINGKPLTKAEAPLSRNYEYAGQIDNPGGNPVTWSVDILTPFDIPFSQDRGGQVDYVLRIVDVSGTNRSAPLEIYYRQPQAYVPQIITGTTSMSTSTPPGASRATGPCAGGAQQQSFLICWRKSGSSPYTAGTSACSYSEAVRLLSNSFPDFSSSQGACP
jgi:hypothetical protein